MSAPDDGRRGPAAGAVATNGLWFGLVAYSIWGLFPLYWPLLQPSGAVEILAHRMVWSLLVSAVVLTVVRGWPALRAMSSRTWLLVMAGAVVISVNWGLYIWAVNSDQVVEAALGYFINPLVTVALGVVVFSERLRIAQWVAVGLGALAVAVLTVAGGSFPWIALTLAASFATYGLIKKVIPVAPTTSLTAEGLVLLVPAAGYLIVLGATGGSTVPGNGAGHLLLLIGTGVITCVPLLAFAAAARRLPLSVLGLLQYLTPTVQFLLGVLWFGEQMPPARWIGFGLVWLALIVFTTDALRRARTQHVARVAGAERSGSTDPDAQPVDSRSDR
ncbi:EamA family transporter RarD [Nakamurella flava]|uniref:EamA family transporter RarD n=1 Tax=Nakamurella flava TaxID=2576308 RepID=UPI00197B483F|nr:EamA family transporter RarD [Nakamurella flava]